MADNGVAQDQIKAYVDRILRLKEETKAINLDIREIYAEAKGNGFDKTVLGKVVAYVEKRASGASELEEAEAVFELYLTAYDGHVGRVGTARATHTHASEETDDEEQETQPTPPAAPDLAANPAPSVDSRQVTPIPAATEAQRSTPVDDVGGGGEAPSQKAAGETIPSDQPQARPEVLPEISGKPEATIPDEARNADTMPASDETTSPLKSAGKPVELSSSAAPADVVADEQITAVPYGTPGIVFWVRNHTSGVHRHDYSIAFKDYGQDHYVIADDMSGAKSEPIVMIGDDILDGWARYLCARGTVGLDGQTAFYPVMQYDGTDPMIDCIKWNVAGRLMSDADKSRVAQALIKLEPKRKADIIAAMEMELVS